MPKSPPALSQTPASALDTFLTFYEAKCEAGNLKGVPSDEATSRLERDLEDLKTGLAAIREHSRAKEQLRIGGPKLGS